MLNKIGLFVLFSLCFTAISASHLTGTVFSYRYVSSTNVESTYEITLEFYSDCYNGSPQAMIGDSIASIGIYDNDTKKLDRIETFWQTGPFFGKICTYLNYCSDLYRFTKKVTLKNNNSGYILTYSRCCRSNIYMSLSEKDNGMTSETFIPPYPIQNNSPVFYFKPTTTRRTNFTTFDFGAFDIDGDSLVYNIVKPYGGGSATKPFPGLEAVYTQPKTLNFKIGFSHLNPFGTSGVCNLDTTTGKLELKSTTSGSYAFCIEVREYRKGELIGTIRRDYPYVFEDAPPTTSPQNLKLLPPFINKYLRVTLAWQLCPHVYPWYWLERKKDFETQWTIINQGAINEPYEDKVEAGVEYHYRVRAISAKDTFISNIDTVLFKALRIEKKVELEAKLYPNPFTETFRVTSLEHSVGKVLKIFSLQGLLMKEYPIESYEAEFSTHDLPQGPYLITISDKQGATFRQLMFKQ